MILNPLCPQFVAKVCSELCLAKARQPIIGKLFLERYMIKELKNSKWDSIRYCSKVLIVMYEVGLNEGLKL